MLSHAIAIIRRTASRRAPGWQLELDTLAARINAELRSAHTAALRVLIGPSFAVYPPSYAMDRLLSYALRLRGAEVVPIYCDRVQRVECNYFGGDWKGNQSFDKNCSMCDQTSRSLWQHAPRKAVPLSDFVSDTEIDRIRTSLSGLGVAGLLQYRQAETPIGLLAKDILANNHLVASIELIPEYEDLLRVHVENLLVVDLAYGRILDRVRPDRAISNDSYYGMWALMEHHCRARGIPFYSHWPVTQSRVAFASDDAAMNLDFRASWPAFSQRPLSSRDEERVTAWLKGDRGYVIDTTRLAGHERDDPAVNRVDPRKPTLVLAANVIWDLAALNKQVVFQDMMQWIIETMRWFAARGDLQLIVRPHPAEVSPQIPRTRESVASAIRASGISVPPNVFVLGADAKITLMELIRLFNVRGVAVHTSTVGFECAALGLPVITTARAPYRGFGFTTDPETREGYFSAITQVLTESQTPAPARQELARKFIKFYQFHYYANLGLFSGNPPVLEADVLGKLKSDGGVLGYVVDSILRGLPINGVDRWLPES